MKNQHHAVRVLCALGLMLLAAITVQAKEGTTMGIEVSPYGTTKDGIAVNQYALTNQNGLRAVLIEFGAIMVSFETPDRDGKMANINLGCPDLAGYEEDSPYFGSVVGRCANRIAKGKFTLDGTEYTLATNNDANHLHGGVVGFNKVVWRSEGFTTANGVGVKFTYLSKDMEEGYPGNLTVVMKYTLSNDNTLSYDYKAITDKATVVNLSQHSYWNLGGHSAGTILDHELMINAANCTLTDETLIPTGEITPVEVANNDNNPDTTSGNLLANNSVNNNHVNNVSNRDTTSNNIDNTTNRNENNTNENLPDTTSENLLANDISNHNINTSENNNETDSSFYNKSSYVNPDT
ncbi:MAG: galactose mutarotase, partial [Candidatus Hydrogenedentes bacterium]|nr:galactose mutarotase [Candidatus Hydrogenedentota bacterium]